MERPITSIGILFLIIGVFSVNIIHLNAQGESKNDHDYWFFYGNDIRDIRDFSTVLERVGHGTVKTLENGDFIIGTGFHASDFSLTKYDKNKKELWKCYSLKYPAPNWKYGVYEKNGDIWVYYIDWETGETYGDKQLTQLGVFGRTRVMSTAINIYGWYKNKLIFRTDKGEAFLLNTRTGQIEKFLVRLSSRTGIVTSPDGRYISKPARVFRLEGYRGDYEGKIYDFETNKLLEPADKAVPVYWLNDTIYITAVSRTKKVSENYERYGKIAQRTKSYEQFIIRYNNINNLSDYEELMLFDESNYPNNYDKQKGYKKYSVPKVLFDNAKRYSHILSISYSDLKNVGHLFYRQKTPESTWYTKQSAYILDINRGKTHLLSPDSYNLSNYESIDKEHIVYSLKNDILTQGTFLMNLKTGEKKKITPYIADRFWHFEKAGYILFIANNILYRCDSDGENLKELQKGAARAKISLFNGQSKEDARA